MRQVDLRLSAESQIHLSHVDTSTSTTPHSTAPSLFLPLSLSFLEVCYTDHSCVWWVCSCSVKVREPCGFLCILTICCSFLYLVLCSHVCCNSLASGLKCHMLTFRPECQTMTMMNRPHAECCVWSD